ncbi:hypothetical protein TNCV_2301131 [Trichonephila clavipes]|nr:hypothetical protein TNCV_2301131 [Trichonephila clavipes]
MSSFQTSLGSACSILMAVYVSEISEEITLWHRFPVPGVRVRAAIGYMTRTSLVQINDNLNADRCIADILFPVAMPYLQGLLNALTYKITQDHMLHIML